MLSGTENGSKPERKVRHAKSAYKPYLTAEDVEKELSANKMFEGILRINKKNNEEAFVDNPDGSDFDILIFGLLDRNRALHGDQVVFRIKDRQDWIVNENEYKLWKKQNNFVENSINMSDFNAVEEKEQNGLINTFKDGLVIERRTQVNRRTSTKVITYSREELLSLRLCVSTSDKGVANFQEFQEKIQQ
uniref:Rrp44_CSD1 domain-containing protein n=1 Tax=Syphacia muris TaxID=451379 RepID=A0A0N5AWI2_9BILA